MKPEEHPNLSDEVNAAIKSSEESWGFKLSDIPDLTFVEVQTQNTLYTLVKEEKDCTIIGHPKYCPHPTRVRVAGCTFGGSMLKVDHLFEGGYLEFVILEGYNKNKTVTTSRIKSVRILEREEEK